MIVLNGVALTPDLSGALYWDDQRTLIVADLHFEKASHFAARGQHIPRYDTGVTLAALKDVIDLRAPERVICLGDSFHDSDAGARLEPENTATLRDLTARLEWIWVAGNHDPTPPDHLGGTVVHDFCLGPLTFRHIAEKDAHPGEVSGHFHPKAAVPTKWRRVVRPCFALNATRLILPAFGSFTGGLNVWDPAIAALLAPDFEVVMLGKDKLHHFDGADLDNDLTMYYR
jgi:DNA ligase-associated metallophosphoesterase